MIQMIFLRWAHGPWIISSVTLSIQGNVYNISVEVETFSWQYIYIEIIYYVLDECFHQRQSLLIAKAQYVKHDSSTYFNMQYDI